MTIAADRVEFFAREMAALGCKVSDKTDEFGVRQVLVSGASVWDSDNVIVSYTPASAKAGKGRRDSLHCLIFSTRKYPRKGYGTVEYGEARRHASAFLRSWTEHTHCEPGRHTCGVQ